MAVERGSNLTPSQKDVNGRIENFNRRLSETWMDAGSFCKEYDELVALREKVAKTDWLETLLGRQAHDSGPGLKRGRPPGKRNK